MAEPTRTAAPIPSAILAPGALHLGGISDVYRYDFEHALITGVADTTWMNVQVIHNRLIAICNDYTFDHRNAAEAANLTQVNAWKALAATYNVGNGWDEERALAAYLNVATRGLFLAQAPNLDDPSYFTITSPQDAHYLGLGLPGNSATRFTTSRGTIKRYHLALKRIVAGAPYVNTWTYLWLPYAMVSGRTYSVTQGDGRTATFVYHEDVTISQAIKVNQSGYSPSIPSKMAYLSAWQPGVGAVPFHTWEGEDFEVVDANTRQVVLTGQIELLSQNYQSNIQFTRPGGGDDIYALDLSDLAATGEFYIRIAGVGRSWPFMHHTEAIGRAWYTHLRGMFHQRAGHALDAQYTGWPRPLAHDRVYNADYAAESRHNIPPVEAFSAIAAYKAANNDVEWLHEGSSVSGGWYDAADYDRRIYHYECIQDMLLAYEHNSAAFTDGQENTYESTNGIPDLLDEIIWGLRIWRESQDGNGGVAGHVEAVQHPSPIDAIPDGRPHNDPQRYYFSARTRGASLSYAANAAHLARLLVPFDAVEAAAWLASAVNAYEFGADPTNHYTKVSYFGGAPFSESQTEINMMQCMAALDLFMATETASYMTTAVALFPVMLPDLGWPLAQPRQHFWWAFYDHASIPSGLKATAHAYYVAAGDLVVDATEEPFYHSPVSQTDGYPPAWGKATGVFQARYAAMAYALTGEAQYLQAIAYAADWLHGCNPMGVSWTTGIGYNYPWCILHGESEEDTPIDPVPGITVYGPHGGFNVVVKSQVFNFQTVQPGEYLLIARGVPGYIQVEPYDSSPRIPLWRMFIQTYHDDPPMCEFTMNETISPAVLAYSFLMPTGWTPGARLLAQAPRASANIYGQWMLP